MTKIDAMKAARAVAFQQAADLAELQASGSSPDVAKALHKLANDLRNQATASR